MNNIKKISNIEVEYTPVVVEDNFDLIESQLKQKLESLSLIVGEDDVKVAKKSATEINAMIKVIDRFRIDKKKEMLVPITDFEEKAKKLSALCDESRQKLLSQVKVFTDKKVALCLELLESELESQYSQSGLREEFKKVEYKDLAIASSLGTKDTLVPRVVKTLMARVAIALKHQEQIDSRLIALANVCTYAGLVVPLNKDRVKHFLYEPNDLVYQQKLDQLINMELANQKAMQEQLKQKAIDDAKKLEDEKLAKMIASNKSQNTQPSPQPQAALINNADFQRKPISSKKTYTVCFEVEIDEKYEPYLNQILAKKFNRYESDCFKDVPNFKVHTTDGRIL